MRFVVNYGMPKKEKNEEYETKRLEKWRIGRANYP